MATPHIQKRDESSTANERGVKQPLILHLKGTQEEMGEQHARLLLEQGGWQEAMDFYPRMPALLLATGLPRRLKGGWFETAFKALSRVPLERLEKARPAAFRRRTEAFVATLGLPEGRSRDLMVMDVFQNAVNLLGRFGLLEKSKLGATAAGCCSTLMVWDEASSDGELRHARNFDFPGIGIWDTGPTVVFCTPDTGIRYGFVTTRGADVPGVTAFNEAGLSVTLHTRFHRDIALEGTPVVDVGHDIVCRAETLEDAIAVAAEYRTASSWGIMVSSGAERSAVALEVNASGVSVVEPAEHHHLAAANRYRTAQLQEGEVTTSMAFAVHSDLREARLDQAAGQAAQAGGLSPAHLRQLLADDTVPGLPGQQVGAGDIVSQPITVKSVVMEPESRRLQLATGRAPAATGPWATVDWTWDHPVGATQLDEKCVESVPRNAEVSSIDARVARALYVEACRAHMMGEADRQVRALLDRAVSLRSDEPHYRFLAGIFALMMAEAETALTHFERSLEVPQIDFRLGQTLLWAARAADVSGHPARAASFRERLSQMDAALLAGHQEKAELDAIRPWTRWRCGRIVPNLPIVDAQ